MATIFQPPPTWADPMLEVDDPRTGEEKFIFNPVWLKWFLDLTAKLPSTGAGGGNIVGPTSSTANRIALFSDTTGIVLKELGSLGTTTTLLHGNAAGAPTFGTVTLTTDVTGILPTANGGTGIAFFTAAGPTVARVYTFPDAAATILYSGGALGTPSSGTATNLTGTASGLTAGTVTTNANLTGPITSSGNATAVASQTGTGSKFVMDTSPTLITPTLGVAAATSVTFPSQTALANYKTGSWTVTGNSFTEGGVVTLTGTYVRIGRLVFASIVMTDTVSYAGIFNTSYFTGLPFTVATRGVVMHTANAAATSTGVGYAETNNRLYPWTFAGTSQANFTAIYETDDA